MAKNLRDDKSGNFVDGSFYCDTILDGDSSEVNAYATPGAEAIHLVLDDESFAVEDWPVIRGRIDRIYEAIAGVPAAAATPVAAAVGEGDDDNAFVALVKEEFAAIRKRLDEAGI